MLLLFDKVSYYYNLFIKRLQTFLFKVLTVLSFLMLAFYFGYIVYYSVVSFNGYKAIVGCLALFTMIHLNKSL